MDKVKDALDPIAKELSIELVGDFGIPWTTLCVDKIQRIKTVARKLLQAHNDYFEWGHTPQGHDDLKAADAELKKLVGDPD